MRWQIAAVAGWFTVMSQQTINAIICCLHNYNCNKTYANNAPATIGANNRFVYATASHKTLTYQVGNVPLSYNDASCMARPALSLLDLRWRHY